VNPPARLRASHGFSLIELAVVILVLTLLLGSLLTPLNAQLQQRQIEETQRVLDDTREALLGFAMASGRLPRPAQSYAIGQERTADCTTHEECTGFIPWALLGTSRTDAWGKLIRYSVSPGLAQTGVGITLSSNGTKRIRTRDASGTPILADGVAAVLISHGAHEWGRTIDGTDIADGSSTNIDEDANALQFGRSGDPFYARSISQNASSAGGEFDDLVAWIPQAILLGRLLQAGRLP
jgi:prepilin-type N-terminal cleavage/methylation domain-containing protein